MQDISSIVRVDVQGATPLKAAVKPARTKKAAEVPGISGNKPVTVNQRKSSKTTEISASNKLNNIPGATSKIVAEVNKNLRLINADLALEVDRDINRVILRVIDAETGETIKQIPSEELINIAKRLKFMIENYSNKSANSTQLFLDTASYA